MSLLCNNINGIYYKSITAFMTVSGHKCRFLLDKSCNRGYNSKCNNYVIFKSNICGDSYNTQTGDSL